MFLSLPHRHCFFKVTWDPPYNCVGETERGEVGWWWWGRHQLSICVYQLDIFSWSGVLLCSVLRLDPPVSLPRLRESSGAMRGPRCSKQLADFTASVWLTLLLSSRTVVVILLLQLAQLSVGSPLAGQVTVWVFSQASALRIMSLSGERTSRWDVDADRPWTDKGKGSLFSDHGNRKRSCFKLKCHTH